MGIETVIHESVTAEAAGPKEHGEFQLEEIQLTDEEAVTVYGRMQP